MLAALCVVGECSYKDSSPERCGTIITHPLSYQLHPLSLGVSRNCYSLVEPVFMLKNTLSRLSCKMVPPIAILGAGPSGLALGRLLDLAGIDFTVFERDSSAASAWGRGGSGTLDLHEGSGLLALQKAGLFEEFKKKAR